MFLVSCFPWVIAKLAAVCKQNIVLIVYARDSPLWKMFAFEREKCTLSTQFWKTHGLMNGLLKQIQIALLKANFLSLHQLRSTVCLIKNFLQSYPTSNTRGLAHLNKTDSTLLPFEMKYLALKKFMFINKLICSLKRSELPKERCADNQNPDSDPAVSNLLLFQMSFAFWSTSMKLFNFS